MYVYRCVYMIDQSYHIWLLHTYIKIFCMYSEIFCCLANLHICKMSCTHRSLQPDSKSLPFPPQNNHH